LSRTVVRNRWILVASLAAVAACETAVTGTGQALLSVRVVAADGVALGAIDQGRAHIEGPTPRTLDIAPGTTQTIEGLQPGSYTVALEGLTGGEVEVYGETSVTVVAGTSQNATVTLHSFVSKLATLPVSGKAGQIVHVQFTVVSGATGYRIEWATNATFTNLQAVDMTTASVPITLSADGTYYFRVRARNRFGSISPPGTNERTTVATHLFSFVQDASADVGGRVGTNFGGAMVADGHLLLDGTAGYVELDAPIVPDTGSFSVALFARESFRKSGFVEFMSQGRFYIGHTPTGNVRVSDAWVDTGIPMPQDNLEHHYAATFDATANTIRLYIDGQFVGSRNAVVSRGQTSLYLPRFGRQFGNAPEYLPGEIDDVSVYGSILDASDVEALARRTADLPCTAESGMRTESASTVSYMVFENRSGEPVRIDWLDDSGSRIPDVPSVEAGASHVQGSFLTQPWIVTGLTTGTCYGIWLPVSTGRIVQVG
jgi:Concanavalin A-like lectin/glucanases superfamily